MKRFDFLNQETRNLFPTGVATYDSLVGGGGYPAASLNLIDEDQYQQYSTMLAKAFVSLGITKEEKILVFSEEIKSRNHRFFRELPSVQTCQDSGASQAQQQDMKIAFRYANLPSRFSADQFGEDTSAEKFDFGTHVSSDTVESANVEFFSHSQICDVLFSLTQQKPKGRHRIFVHSLGSLLSSLDNSRLVPVMFKIKCLMRKLKNMTSFVTLSPEIDDGLESSSARKHLHRLADSTVKLVAFADDGNDTNPYSGDYVGIIQLVKHQQLNSFTPYNRNLESNEYGIKLRNSKRNLNFEKLSLPPDLGETVSRFTSSEESAKKLPCSSKISF